MVALQFWLNLGCLRVKKELNDKKGCVKISHYVQFSGHIPIWREVIGMWILAKTWKRG